MTNWLNEATKDHLYKLAIVRGTVSRKLAERDMTMAVTTRNHPAEAITFEDEQHLSWLRELYVEPPHEQQVLRYALMRTRLTPMDIIGASTCPLTGQTQDKG